MQSIRLPGESDDAFSARIGRAACYAKLLIDAALSNHCIGDFIADAGLPYSEESERENPTVRIEFDQAIAIGQIGECLRATKYKHWGGGPYIHPLHRDDPVHPMRILYVFKDGSLLHQRFRQRERLKSLLGARHRALVSRAKRRRQTKAGFLQALSDEEALAIRRILDTSPERFYSACPGRVFLDLPPEENQLYFPFVDE